MTHIKDGILYIEPEPPRPCEYCGEVAECRPWGINRAMICHSCSQKPENKELADKMLIEYITQERVHATVFTIKGNSLETFPP